MRSLAKLGFVAMGFGLVLSLAACAVMGEESESSTADFSHGRGPGRGRPPGQPVLADDLVGEDAGPTTALPPGAELAAVDPDASVPAPVVEDDASAPVVEEDAGEPPPPPPPAEEVDAG